MDMLTIELLGSKILTQRAKRVARVDDSIRTLCIGMINTMIANEGVGLAANQVGVLKRIIVVSDDHQIKAMINPEIISFSEEECFMEEGCLSIPEVHVQISRPESIKIKYRDTKGKPHIESYSGLTARVIQHEIDHLDGITMNNK